MIFIPSNSFRGQRYEQSRKNGLGAGANESTTISFSTDVTINGKPLAAGTYGFFIVLYPDSCTLIFNRNTAGWGSYFYNSDMDVLRVTTRQQKDLKEIKERLDYTFSNQTDRAVEVALEWEKWRIPFKVEVDLLKTTLASIHSQLSGAMGFDPPSLEAAAAWCLQNNVNYEEALSWINVVVDPNLGRVTTFHALSTKAGLLAKLNKNGAAELLDRMVAAGHGERPALWAPVDGKPVHCTYRQLLARANRIARALGEDLGLVPGNRVLLRGPNNPMMAACWLGIVKAGGIVVATMPLLRAKELTQVAVKARCSLALCDARLLEELELARPDCPDLKRIVAFGDGTLESLLEAKPETFDNVDTAADDVALIAFTSGTTGQPKGTMHFHRDVLAMCDAFPRSVLKPGPDDVFCGTPPLAFTFGLGGLLCFPLRAGASTVLVERLMPDTLMQTIRDCKATICFTAPTFWRLMAPLAEKGGIGIDRNPDDLAQANLTLPIGMVEAGDLHAVGELFSVRSHR